MIKTVPNKIEIPAEISKNFKVFKERVEGYLQRSGLDLQQIRLEDLTEHKLILQLLFTDHELLKEYLETFEDILALNDETQKQLKSIKESMNGQIERKKKTLGAKQVRELIFKILLDEIKIMEQDDEIKESFDLAAQSSEELFQKLGNLGGNKENFMGKKSFAKKIQEEKKEEQEKKTIVKKIKKMKEQIMQRSKNLENVNFEEKKRADVQIFLGEDEVIKNDCPPILRVETDEDDQNQADLVKLEKQTCLRVLGENENLRDVFADWADKPMLRVITHESKVEIENNRRKRQNQRGREKNLNTPIEKDEKIEEFLKKESKMVEDSVDLFEENGYMYDLYMSGNQVYRDVERRYLFPYSDSLHRYSRSHMLSTTRDYYEEMRRNILCYEREASKNFIIDEFYRMDDDEENTRPIVMVLNIFKISDLSRDKEMGMTANFFALNERLFPIQGTASFKNINNFYVFEGQYVCVYGKFVKRTLNVEHVLPFDPVNLAKNKWNSKDVKTKSDGRIYPRPELEDEVAGKMENKDGWLRSLEVINIKASSLGNQILEEVGF